MGRPRPRVRSPRPASRVPPAGHRQVFAESVASNPHERGYQQRQCRLGTLAFSHCPTCLALSKLLKKTEVHSSTIAFLRQRGMVGGQIVRGGTAVRGIQVHAKFGQSPAGLYKRIPQARVRMRPPVTRHTHDADNIVSSIEHLDRRYRRKMARPTTFLETHSTCTNLLTHHFIDTIHHFYHLHNEGLNLCWCYSIGQGLSSADTSRAHASRTPAA